MSNPKMCKKVVTSFVYRLGEENKSGARTRKALRVKTQGMQISKSSHIIDIRK